MRPLLSPAMLMLQRRAPHFFILERVAPTPYVQPASPYRPEYLGKHGTVCDQADRAQRFRSEALALQARRRIDLPGHWVIVTYPRSEA